MAKYVYTLDADGKRIPDAHSPMGYKRYWKDMWSHNQIIDGYSRIDEKAIDAGAKGKYNLISDMFYIYTMLIIAAKGRGYYKR